MTEVWQWFLTIGGGIILISNVIAASIKLFKYLKSGKKNADAYFEKRVRSAMDIIVAGEADKNEKAREREISLLKEFISSELAPIRENQKRLIDSNQILHHAILTDLKIKLRHMYYHSFEANGLLDKDEKHVWDKLFSDYTHLGGNSDIKAMNEQVQKVHFEIVVETQKSKAKRRKKEGFEE